MAARGRSAGILNHWEAISRHIAFYFGVEEEVPLRLRLVVGSQGTRILYQGGGGLPLLSESMITDRKSVV